MSDERTDPDELSARMVEEPARNSRFNFRNPSLKWRVFLVAIVVAVPGALAGGMVSLLLGDFLSCVVVGALVGAIAGAVLEARPPSASHDPPDVPRPDPSDEW